MFEQLRIGESAKSAKKFTPVHPNSAIGKKHGISLMLHGKHSEEYRNAIASMIRRSKDSEQSVDDSIEESAKLIVACCGGWEGVTEGSKAVKFSREKLLDILKDDDFRWMRLQAEKFMAQDSHFFPKPS